MTKSELRILYKAKRKALTDVEFEKLNDLLLIHWQKLPIPFLNAMMSYFPIYESREPDPQNIEHFSHYQNPGISISFPRLTGDNTMEAIDSTDYTPTFNKYHIMEIKNGEIIAPDVLDVVIVPLLAFDKQGNRVGFGKGFYDRYLARCADDVIKVGLSFFEPVHKIADVDEYDIPLTYCITPNELYEFA
jgi:5-formyltetrahydrofolate cyclo-ligase